MKCFLKIKTIRASGLTFAVREGTSDFKAIKEVVIQQAYKRKNFVPEDGENWIDIGANCGAFSVWAASLGANVTAFEPDPENASIARASVEANNLGRRVKIHEAGITEKDDSGTAILHRNTANGNLWRNSLYKRWQGGESIKVKLIPIETFWNQNACVKLDAEGIEMPILEKYAERKVKKLVFEWSFDIDPSLTRFERVIESLKKTYQNVVYSSYKSGYTVWQPSWFPACRTIWCY